jgi:predicted RNA-binding protein with PIN domain
MPYLIDGHNLIASVPGLQLSDPDDEAKLIDLLRGFCAREQTRVTVYFDRGLFGAGSAPAGGRVTVRFVRPPRTADEAIAAHLKTLGGDARNWTVVSSDREVLRSARRAGARPIGSGAFARQISHGRRPQPSEKPETPTGGEEVTYWERRFRERGRRG